MARAVTNEDRIMKELPRVIEWMSALGLPARNSRYARYDEHINKFFRSGLNPLSDEGRQLFKELSQAYREYVDIYVVYQCFEHVRHPNFIDKLSKVVEGQDVPDLQFAGASRNYLFELLVAARFHLAGYEIDFDESSDVVALRDGLVVRAECKRLASEKQLEKRVYSAADQLAKAIAANSGEVIGIVYIDVSSCLVADVKQQVDTADDAEREMAVAMQNFLIRNANKIEELNRKHINISYATCLIGTLPIWSKDLVLHSSSITAVRAAETLSDMRFEQLQKVLAYFDETLIKLF